MDIWYDVNMQIKILICEILIYFEFLLTFQEKVDLWWSGIPIEKVQITREILTVKYRKEK